MIQAILSFDVDAESPILAEGRRYAENAGVMSHQAYGPLVGVPRIIDLLQEYGLPVTFFVPGVTAERYPDAVEQILAAGHEVGHHSYAHVSPFDRTKPPSARTSNARSSRSRASASSRRAFAVPVGS